MSDYWLEVSYGLFNTEVDHPESWIRLSLNSSYYGKDLGQDTDVNICDLVTEAFSAADPLFDYGKYRLFVIMHTAGDQATTRRNSDIWSSAQTSPLRWACGLRLTSGEEENIGGVAIVSSSDPMGVWAHELGHLLGLPDLYNSELQSGPDDFVGKWDLMAAGSWNGPSFAPGSSPSHITSWGKIKLGWLSGERVATVEKGRILHVTLSPLELGDGLAAVKIPISSTEYYLVELRLRLGFDRYLPSEGVLILKVDEARASGEGIVRVVGKEVSSGDLNNAALGPGKTFEDRQREISVTVQSRSGKEFLITVQHGPPSFPLTILTNAPLAKVYINGTPHTADLAGRIVAVVYQGHIELSVEETYQVNETLRYLFTSWTIDDKEVNLFRIIIDTSNISVIRGFFIKQFFVEVSSDIGEVYGTGWYDEGAEALVGVAATMLDCGDRTRCVFDDWLGLNSKEPKTSVTVTRALSITARWRQEHYVEILEPLARPGSGWYEKGSRLTLRVDWAKAGVSDKERFRFERWGGDVESTDNEVSIVVDSPKLVKVEWVKQYLVEVNIEPVSRYATWVDEGKEFSAEAPSEVILSNSSKLVFVGWKEFPSETRRITFIVTRPTVLSSTWANEYRVEIVPTDFRDDQLEDSGNLRLTLSGQGGQVQVAQPFRLWLREGRWSIEKAEWRGVTFDLNTEVDVHGPVTVRTQLPFQTLRVVVSGWLGQPITDAAVSVRLQSGAWEADGTSDERGEAVFRQTPAKQLEAAASYRGVEASVSVNGEWVTGGEVRIRLPIYFELLGVPLTTVLLSTVIAVALAISLGVVAGRYFWFRMRNV